MDGVNTSYALEPLEGLVHHEDGEYRRSVVHRKLVYVIAVVKHAWQITGNLAEQILLDDGKCNPGRSGIFLCSAVNEGIFADIHPAAEYVRRHIGNQRNRAVDIFLDFSTIDGIVRSDVEIVDIGRDLVSLRDIRVIPVLRAGKSIGFSEALGLLESLVSPDTGIEIRGLVLEIIHSDIKELETCAAAQEHDLIAFRNIKKFFPQGAALVHNGIPLLGPM